MPCRICGHAQARATWQARESMRGTGEVFRYEECAACGCLQIAEVPADLSLYYGPGYYATDAQRPAARYLRGRQMQFLATGRGSVGRLVNRLWPLDPGGDLGVPKDARLLEVGCGNGYYLAALLAAGYRDLTGVDPHMDPQAVRSSPIRLERKTLLDVDAGEGLYGAIVFGHSLEHIPEQHETLDKVRELLAPDGVCIIRVPTVSSWAWEHYRTDWAQLDAPRHLYLHSRESLCHLAASHGLAVQRVVCDSTAFQFWGSEQCRAGIPLLARDSYHVDPRASRFHRKQITEFTARAEQLNREGLGDQIAVHLRLEGTP